MTDWTKVEQAVDLFNANCHPGGRKEDLRVACELINDAIKGEEWVEEPPITLFQRMNPWVKIASLLGLAGLTILGITGSTVDEKNRLIDFFLKPKAKKES